MKVDTHKRDHLVGWLKVQRSQSFGYVWVQDLNPVPVRVSDECNAFHFACRKWSTKQEFTEHQTLVAGYEAN